MARIYTNEISKERVLDHEDFIRMAEKILSRFKDEQSLTYWDKDKSDESIGEELANKFGPNEAPRCRA